MPITKSVKKALRQSKKKRKINTFFKKKIKKVRSYASGIGLNADSVTPEFIDAMHEAGLHVHPYTVNEPKAIYSMNMLGADGIFTDKPDVANHLKKQINEMEVE